MSVRPPLRSLWSATLAHHRRQRHNTFIGAILACGTAGTATLGFGSPCKNLYGSSFTDACKPVGTRWVEPAYWGTNFVPVHPNALGEREMASAVLRAL